MPGKRRSNSKSKSYPELRFSYEYESKQVRSQAAPCSSRDSEREGEEEVEGREEVKKAVEERRRKGKQWERKLVSPSRGRRGERETCELCTLIAFKNREFAPATRKLSENLDSFH